MITRNTASGNPDYTIWVDVEDLFEYAKHNPRPSGIQRLVFEIITCLEASAAARPLRPQITFVRQGPQGEPLLPVALSDITELFSQLTGTEDRLPGHSPASVSVSSSSIRSVLRRILRGNLRSFVIKSLTALPVSLGTPLIRAGIAQMRVFRQLNHMLQSRKPRALSVLAPDASPLSDTPSPYLPPNIKAGDIFLVLGAPWASPAFSHRIKYLRQKAGMQPVLLIHDLIPIRRPEWCPPALVRLFSEWVEKTLPHCARVLANSHATATDVRNYIQEKRLNIPETIPVIPLGTAFGVSARTDIETSKPLPGLPAPGTYMLFVSTMEARKNHLFLFRIWCRLLQDLPRHKVPTLVFAGRPGLLVADLLQQLENTRWLDGKVRLIDNPDDDELLALYKGCQCTLFPSLFEGWGLPVTESLALGRPCLAASTTSLPEAGGKISRYFDPENLDDGYRAVRAIIDNPDELQKWQDDVKTLFRHISWEKSADAVLSACEETFLEGKDPRS